MSIVDVITQKRDGHELDADTIKQLITQYVAGEVPDYQMSALLMAIVWRGMSSAETLTLTQAMVNSGDVLDPGKRLNRKIVDKHSTGGVGDKVSLVLAPLIAACGVPLGKMSGRGLGHTGGTLDKLEAIPGLTVDLSSDRYYEQVASVGCAIAGQTGDLVPADKQLYALRDVTGTVESIPLIAASIMSKKLAGGADAIVLDVKVGSGGFLRDLDRARKLADEMIAIGNGAGREVKVLLTNMATPLGNAIGNANEIHEVVETLQGHGPQDLVEVVLAAAGVLLSMSDLDVNESEGQKLAVDAIESGSALAKYREWITAQGGDPDAQLELAPCQHTVNCPSAGTITAIDALESGLAAARLGAGRASKADKVDHAVGITLRAKVGDVVSTSDPLATIYARSDEAAQQAGARVLAATSIGSANEPVTSSVILEHRG